MNIETIIKKYREKGLKLTPQRLAILKSISGDKTHPSADVIYRRLKKDYPGLSLTTVYNTLELLKDVGEVLELNLRRDKSIFDPNTDPHDHVYCVRCKKVEDIFGSELTGEAIKKAQFKGYEVFSASTYIYGLCKECRD